MSGIKSFVIASAAVVSLGSSASHAQQPPPQSPNMTFFVTSNGPGKGADLGGLEGADRHCQTLAQAAGAGGKTWRAYLSPQTADGAQAINGHVVLTDESVVPNRPLPLVIRDVLVEECQSVRDKGRG